VKLIGCLLIACACRPAAPLGAGAAGAHRAPADVALTNGGEVARAAAGSAESASVPTARPAVTQGCGEAAAGFESATRGIRAPETSILALIRVRCVEDAWPMEAVDCFAMMTEGDLGRCAGQLPEASRDRMFATLGSGGHATSAGSDHADGADDAGTASGSSSMSIAISLSKLQRLHVGVPACDAFLATVQRVLVCQHMPLQLRAQLGAEAVDFWSLPTSGLSPAVQQKMSEVCGKSLATLSQAAIAADCMP
jgi:hypothetical protein